MSPRRVWSVLKGLLAASLVVGMVAFVATPSFAATPAPAVTSVSPNVGVVGGGSTVTISGANFSAATAVVFGMAPATGVSVVSSTQITATVPAHAAGLVDVRVVAPLGTSPITSGDHYSYQATPIVTAVSAAMGAQAGGNTVTVTGSGFIGVSGVSFGAVAGTNVERRVVDTAHGRRARRLRLGNGRCHGDGNVWDLTDRGGRPLSL